MNSYQINIVFPAEEDARVALGRYAAGEKGEQEYLELAVPLIFDSVTSNETKEINIGSFEKYTNEIKIGCYGSKYPSVEPEEIFGRKFCDS